MQREARLGLYIGIGLLALVALGVGLMITRSVRSLDFIVLFDDAKGLQKGDRVVLSGVDIGRVRGVELGPEAGAVRVPLRIEPAHATKVRADARAVIRSVSFPNVSGQKVVEVLNPSSPPTAALMADGMVINGLNSELQVAAWELTSTLSEGLDAIGEGARALSGQMRDLANEIKAIATSPEAQAALRKLQDFLGEMQERGQSALQDLQQRWPEIRKEVEPVIEQLMEFGRKALADRLQGLISEIEETLKQWNEAAPAAPGDAAPQAPTDNVI